jgi:hypothetical protein
VPRTVGLFCAFQEMRCWQKWWTGFRAGREMWDGGQVVSPSKLVYRV